MNGFAEVFSRRLFSQTLCAGLACLYGNRTILANPNDETNLLVQANNAFALSLLRVVSDYKTSENQFFSPFSIESALSITLEGARNSTADQMGEALHYPKALQTGLPQPWGMDRMRNEFKEFAKRISPPSSSSDDGARKKLQDLRSKLKEANTEAQKLVRNNKYQEANAKQDLAQQLAIQINTLSQSVDQFELQNANSLWLERTYPLSPVFQKTVETSYGSSGTFACDFRGKVEKERERINAWVSQQTKGKIQNIIPPRGIDAMTRLVIANAIYFKGTWSSPFQEQLTKGAPFRVRDGSKVQVPMMTAMGFEAGRYAAFNKNGSKFETPTQVEESSKDSAAYPADGFQVVELPYNGDRLSMIALLPIKPDGIDDLMKGLTAVKLDQCIKGLDYRRFHLKLPKFQLTSTYDLIPPLKSLGMVDAFEPNKADFEGMTESLNPQDRLFISLVIHKAFIEVNEKGTEAAAATIVAMAPTSAAPSRLRPFIPTFQADHPFLTAIVEKESGMVLFLGKVEKP